MGNREQPSDRDPEAISTAQLYLLVGAVSLTTAAMLCAGSHFRFITVGTGVFGILAALTVIGWVGWLVRSAEARVRRAHAADAKPLTDQLAELTSEVRQLRAEVARQQATLPPPAPRRHQTQRHVTAVGIQATTAAIQPPGMDPESIAAARRITSRLRSVDNP